MRNIQFHQSPPKPQQDWTLDSSPTRRIVDISHLIRIQIVLTVLRNPRIAGILLRRPANYSVRQKPHIPRLRCIRAGLVRSRRHAIPPPTSSHHIHGPHQPGLLHAASRVTCPQISGRGLSSPVQLSAVRRIPAADTDTGPSWDGRGEKMRGGS